MRTRTVFTDDEKWLLIKIMRHHLDRQERASFEHETGEEACAPPSPDDSFKTALDILSREFNKLGTMEDRGRFVAEGNTRSRWERSAGPTGTMRRSSSGFMPGCSTRSARRVRNSPARSNG